MPRSTSRRFDSLQPTATLHTTQHHAAPRTQAAKSQSGLLFAPRWVDFIHKVAVSSSTAQPRNDAARYIRYLLPEESNLGCSGRALLLLAPFVAKYTKLQRQRFLENPQTQFKVYSTVSQWVRAAPLQYVPSTQSPAAAGLDGGDVLRHRVIAIFGRR